MRMLMLLVGMLCVPTSGFGAVVLYDSQGFESFNLGNLSGQDGWITDSGQAYTVQDTFTNGGNRAVSITSAGTTDWAFPGTNAFTPDANELLVIEADLARSIGATTPSFAFAIDVYDPAVNRILRFGLHSGGEVIFNTTGGTFLSGVAYNPNEFVSFRAELNFATSTYELFINGTSLTGANDIAFATAGVTQFSDADFQISTNPTATDTGFLDNYRVFTTAVPEPTALLALSSFGLAFVVRRRR